MAAGFERVFSFALANSILKRLGETVTLTFPDGTTQTLTSTFNEQVGFVDGLRRAVFTFTAGVLTVEEADRAQYLTLSGETDQWWIVDVRNDKSGGIEVRADGRLTRQ